MAGIISFTVACRDCGIQLSLVGVLHPGNSNGHDWMRKRWCNLDMKIGGEDVNRCLVLLLTRVGGLLTLTEDQLQNLALT